MTSDDHDEVPLTEHFIEADLPPPPATPTEEERSELSDAYDCLGIRTPLEELAGFARARLDALVRAGEPERAELTRAGEAIAREALRHVMSAGPKEAAQ